MIVPRAELEQILRGEVGETVRAIAPAVGETVWIRENARKPPACLARVVDVWRVPDGYSVLLERVADRFELVQRQAPERSPLRLTRVQRVQLLAGQMPVVEGVGLPPVGGRETVRLSARVTLQVLQITYPRRKDGRRAWRLQYELVDTRDPIRLLRRTPPAHRAGDELEMADDDKAAVRQAARDSFYTSKPSASLTEAGEAPDREWVEVRTKTQREFDHQRRLARHAEKLRERSKAHTKRRKAA